MREMVRKTTENGEDGGSFPVGNYWEERVDTWEDGSPDDHLGPDHVARFAAIADAIRSGHLGPEAQWAIVKREQIAELVRPLELKDPEPAIDQLWELSGRHLRPAHRKMLGSDLSSTARLLNQVTRAAAKLEQLLDQVPATTRQFLEECYVRLPRGYQCGERLGIDTLELTLSNLAHTTYFAAPTLTRERKQPPKILRQMTLRRLVEVVESATGQRVSHSWKKDDEQKAAFQGANGKVVRDFMKLVEPRASERSLVEGLIRIKSSKTTGQD